MERVSVGQGNGQTVLSETVAAEVEALLTASEQAAKALKGEVRRELDSALVDLTTLVAELRDAADRLEERLAGITAVVGGAQSQPVDDDTMRRARLVALNMAANGASRAETARYLSEHFGMAERERLLDSVYESLGGE